MSIPEGITPKQRFKLKMLELTAREAASLTTDEALTYFQEGDEVSAAYNVGYADALDKFADQLVEHYPEVFAS